MRAHTTGSLAQLVGAELIGRPDLTITAIEIVERAGPGMMTFIRSRAFAERWSACRASAALVTRGVDVPGHDPATRALLVVPQADPALIKVLSAFAPAEHRPPPGVHPTAVVDPSARLGAGVAVGPLCVIGPGTTIGDGAVLTTHVTIARDVRIGRATVLHAHVVIQDRCVIGDACLIHPGVVIGADGFGFIPAPDGRGVIKIPHIGTVEVGDAVEIGANTCIDRAKFGATVIGAACKIDNLVQIGHGVQMGRACLVCGGSGIGGSATIGDGAILGGQVGVGDNVSIGAMSRLGAQSGAVRDIPAHGTALGMPAIDSDVYARGYAVFQKLPDLMRRLRAVERALRLAECDSADDPPHPHRAGSPG